MGEPETRANDGAEVDLSELHAVRARLEAVYNHRYQLTGLLDPEGRLLMANRRALEFVGADEQDVLGLPFWETPWWTHSEEVQAGLRDALARAGEGEFVRFETTHVSSSGEPRDYEVSISPVFDDDGSLAYLVPEGYDITDLKNAHRTQLESEARYRAAIENAADAVFLIDDRGRFVDVNHLACESLRYSRDELLSMRVPDVEMTVLGKRGFREIWTASHDVPPVTHEGIHRRKDGTTFPVEVRLGRMEMADGRLLIALVRDITSRKNAEEAVRASEEKYRTFFESSHDPMLLLHDDVFIDCNAATVEILGYEKKEDVLGLPPWELSPERQPDGLDSAVKAGEMIRTAFAEGTHRFEWVHKRRTGEHIPVEITMTAIPSQGKWVLLCVWRDISARKRAEEEQRALETQLRQAQKMEAVGQLAGGVAHDFNNLLQVILGHGELALREPGPNSWNRESLDQMMRAANRASTLVRQLLAFSRKQVLKLQALDLDEVVEDLARMIRRIIGEHIALNLRSEPGNKTVLADRGQIEQILMNLCVNSRDAMTTGGVLSIETGITRMDAACCQNDPWAEPGNYVLLSVTDSGAGMDDATLQHIFEPFFTTKEEGRGTGLGLSTVYGIVRQHKGMVLAESEVGSGTTVRVYLPSSTATEEAEHPQDETVPPGGTETILVAEDDEGVRSLAERVLVSAGYTVLIAGDGNEAIDLFDAHVEDCDLAFLDVVMPGRGGPAVFDHIRESGSRIPILFATGYTSGGVHTGFVLEADTLLIQKPYDCNKLLREVRDALDS